MRNKLFLLFLIGFFLVQGASAAHFIAGFVNDSFDGISANGYEVVLWNPANGVGDNLTDVIGTTGNSGADNFYLIDCELLTNGCSVGDQLNLRVMNNGSDYVSETTSVNVTGAGFDAMPDLRLNSIPNVTLNIPVNTANFSTSNINFSCIVGDPDANLENVTLYGNWSGGWHANETIDFSGEENSINFSKVIDVEGNYEWNCLATDNLSISSFATSNFTFTVDFTPPNISSSELNVTGDVCGVSDFVRVNCTVADDLLSLSSVIIDATTPFGHVNYSASLLAGNTYFADIALNTTGIWEFSCIAFDSANNSANFTSNGSIDVHSADADLTLSSSDIIFSSLNPIEDEIVMINATVTNNGCTDANNFLTGFYNGDPDSSGVQINGNQTGSVSSLSNTTVNITWNAEIGLNNIFVELDASSLISESNESNNEANSSIFVNSWQDFFGNVSLDKILANSGAQNISLWVNESDLSGNLFVVDSESDVSWRDLQAIGRNTTNSTTSNDFSDIDSLLSMASFDDSVANTFTTDGNTPISTQSFFVHQLYIDNVPVINSTSSNNFYTGILWDTSDDSNGEYNIGDSEDLVFVTEINKSSLGAFGTYDYEIHIPVRLREYDNSDTSEVFIYFDLN